MNDPQIITITINRMVQCGYCGGTFRSDDGSNPHDGEACRVGLNLPKPKPHPFLTTKDD